MKYHTIDELDAAIERTARRIIKSYYTDWKNYDRPTYMGYKGSRDRNKKHIIVMFRDCGSYIFSDFDFMDRKSPAEIINYYIEYEAGRNTFYFIDLEKLTFTKTDPEKIQTYIKQFEEIGKAAENAA